MTKNLISRTVAQALHHKVENSIKSGIMLINISWLIFRYYSVPYPHKLLTVFVIVVIKRVQSLAAKFPLFQYNQYN